MPVFPIHMKKWVLDLLTFDIIFLSAPLTFDVMVNYIINWICQFPQSWLVGNSAKNVAKYFSNLQKNLQSKYHGITFKLKKDWLGKTLSSRGKWAKTLSKGIFFGQTMFFSSNFFLLKGIFLVKLCFFFQIFFERNLFGQTMLGIWPTCVNSTFWLNFLKRSDKSNTSKILEKCRDILKSKLKLPTNTFLVKNQMAQIADNI